MGALGWIISIEFNVLLFMGVFFEAMLPAAPVYSYYIVISVRLIAGILFIVSIIKNRDQELLQIEQLPKLERILRVQIVLCFIMGGLKLLFGDITLYAFIFWSIFTGIVYLVYIVKGKRLVGIIK